MIRNGFFLLLLTSSAWAQTPSISVTHPWARATLPHQDEGVAYLTITSAAGDTLTGIETPDADMAMLHATLVQNGVSEMRDVNSVILVPGKPVLFSPNGMHVMLMGMKHPLVAGQTLHLTLSFQKAGQVRIDAPVLPVGTSAPP